MKEILRNEEAWNNILQLWFGGYWDVISEKRKNQISPKNHIHKIRIIFKDFIGAFVRLFISFDSPKGRIWFFSISVNNYTALKGIQEKIPDSTFVFNHSFTSPQEKEGHQLILKYRFFHCLIFPFKIVPYIFFYPSRFFSFYDLLFKTNGVYSECLRILKKEKPRAIIFSNDHEIIPRALLLAANKLKIPTYYVQHAAVSIFFPPLEFKYSLLEGEDSELKYLEIGKTETGIFRIGIPRFDAFCYSINKNEEVKCIGIAYNILDNLSFVDELLRELERSFPALKLIFRPHPSDNRVFEHPKAIYSDPNHEGPFEFLSKILFIQISHHL